MVRLTELAEAELVRNRMNIPTKRDRDTRFNVRLQGFEQNCIQKALRTDSGQASVGDRGEIRAGENRLGKKLRRELSYGTDCRNQLDGTNAVHAREWPGSGVTKALGMH